MMVNIGAVYSELVSNLPEIIEKFFPDHGNVFVFPDRDKIELRFYTGDIAQYTIYITPGSIKVHSNRENHRYCRTTYYDIYPDQVVAFISNLFIDWDKSVWNKYSRLVHDKYRRGQDGICGVETYETIPVETYDRIIGIMCYCDPIVGTKYDWETTIFVGEHVYFISKNKDRKITVECNDPKTMFYTDSSHIIDIIDRILVDQRAQQTAKSESTEEKGHNRVLSEDNIGDIHIAINEMKHSWAVFFNTLEKFERLIDSTNNDDQ